MSDRTGIGVLLVAHGTVQDLDDLPEFVRRIRRGRPASPELVQELRHRYEAIGGSPLMATTRHQSRKLAQRLGLPTLVGMRFWDPTIGTALKRAAGDGIRKLVVLPLAPFNCPAYCDATRDAAAELTSEGMATPELIEVPAWGNHPALVAAHATAIERFCGASSESARLILTVHSLPVAVIRAGDPYPQEVETAAKTVARHLGREALLAYQSQGADGGEWLGPSVEATLRRVAAEGVREVDVAPLGFLADHVETLYDLDIDARARADALGLTFRRVPALNDADALVGALATIVEAALEHS